MAVIGALGPHKGFDLIRNCALDARERNLPIRFIIFGITSGPVHDLSNVTTTGEYREEEIYALLEQHRCHLAFFSSVWPETYSYTLSIALHAKLYPVAFDLGAIAQRIRETGWGELLPLEWMNESMAVNDHLSKLNIPSSPTQSLVPIREDSYVNFVADYYDDFSI